MSTKPVIYEVNLAVRPDAAPAFRTWLGPHIDELLALPGFTSWVIFYIFQAQMDDYWPMLGSDSCVPCVTGADCETAATAAECGAFVGEHFEKCDGDSGCDYTEAPISVWAVVTLCSLPLIPLVWRLTDARRRPPEWFKLTLLFLSFLRYPTSPRSDLARVRLRVLWGCTARWPWCCTCPRRTRR